MSAPLLEVETFTPDPRPPYSVRRMLGGPTHIVGRDGTTIIATVNRDQDGIAEKLAAAPDTIAALGALLDEVVVPDAECRCFLSPPCNDCVKYGALRAAESDARAALKKARGE